MSDDNVALYMNPAKHCATQAGFLVLKCFTKLNHLDIITTTNKESFQNLSSINTHESKDQNILLGK